MRNRSTHVTLAGFALVCLFGCSVAGTLPQSVQCRLNALTVLPKDPKMATVADAIDVVNRVKACDAAPADAGSP